MKNLHQCIIVVQIHQDVYKDPILVLAVKVLPEKPVIIRAVEHAIVTEWSL